jgi:hypothetical protein
MEECIFHIKLMNWPTAGDSQRENCANSSGLHNRAESLIVVNTWALGESTKNPARLVALERTVCLELVFEDPLASHHIGARWSQN